MGGSYGVIISSFRPLALVVASRMSRYASLADRSDPERPSKHGRFRSLNAFPSQAKSLPALTWASGDLL